MHKLDRLILESYSEILKEEVPKDERNVTNINKLPANYRKKLIARYGEPFMKGKYDFISKDMDTYFKAYDRNEETGSTSHKIVKLPSFFKLYEDMVDIIEDIKTLMRSPDVRKDKAAKELFELLKSNYRQLQRYLRTERPEQYDLMKMRRATYEAVEELKKLYQPINENLIEKLEEQEPKPEEEGDKEAPKDTVLEDATDQILSKFPTLKAAIVKLQTEDFKEFIDSIDWISPRPTSFRINLKNGQDYILKWTGKSFQAEIQGKRYFINKIDDYQQALDKLSILYKEGPMKGAGEEGEGAELPDTGGGGGGGDFPGDDTGGGDAAADVGDDDTGGADLTDEPVDFEEPGEEPEA